MAVPQGAADLQREHQRALPGLRAHDRGDRGAGQRARFGEAAAA
jgi:hypothetical protein